MNNDNIFLTVFFWCRQIINMELYKAAQNLNMYKIKDLVMNGANINKKFKFNGYNKTEDVLTIISSNSRYENRLKNIRKCISMRSDLDHEIHSYTWLCIIWGC